MTSNQDKNLLLSEAMSFLDDDLIAEAHGEAVGKRLDSILRQRLMKNIGLVAGIVLLALCIPHFAQMNNLEVNGGMAAPPQNDAVGNSKEDFEGVFDGANDVLGGNTYGEPEEYCGVGCMVQGTHGSLTFVSETNTTVSLRMTLTQDTSPIYVYFYDYAGVKATTQPNYTNNGVVIREGRLKVTANGEPVDGSLPTAAGTYDIVIDFSSLLKDDIPMRQVFKISNFPPLLLKG